MKGVVPDAAGPRDGRANQDSTRINAKRERIQPMKRCSRRPLDATVFVLLLAAGAAAQDGVPVCDPTTCEGDPISSRRLCNEDLEGVTDFEPNTTDDDGNVTKEGTTGRRLCNPNLAVAALLSRFDIDGDGVADNAPDTDGDGLPDNWERGGYEALTANGEQVDRIVFFPAPSAIVPGTPPTPIFTRLAVATDALNPDTDDDGISDFVEVFGLMFIDENRNGLLDGNEWWDKNSDGLPSPGEFPADNSRTTIRELEMLHDFDGFTFTDPTNRDTDGDGQLDGLDNDPLINPRAFGNLETIIVRFNAEGNADIDKDGLGNGMDMGNDLVSTDGAGVQDFQVIDNPENVSELLELFRRDLLMEGVVPESQIEDLFGADWDGNGLWRTTDMRTWSLIIDPSDPATTPSDEFFALVPDDPNSHKFYATQTAEELLATFNTDPNYDRYGGEGIGMGWQDLLLPSGRSEFIPDDRVWAVLYAWRVPGFDIDGDGFIGVPNLSATASAGETAEEEDGDEIVSVALVWDAANGRYNLSVTTLRSEADRGSTVDGIPLSPFDDRIEVGGVLDVGEGPELDGRIEVPGFGCGSLGGFILLAMMIGLCVPRLLRRR
jgi:hypothetical protein